ncbi:hypothetical protein Tco_0915291 [Tanacetum coccineum]
MRLSRLTTSGTSLGNVPLYYPFGRGPSPNEQRKDGRSFQILRLTAAHGTPSPLDRHLRRHQHALAKSLQYQQGLLSKDMSLGGCPQTRDLRLWRRRSDCIVIEEITMDEWEKWQSSDISREEMKRLETTGEYMEDEINRLARGGKLRGHILGVGRVLPSRATSRPSMPAPDKSLKSIHKKVDFMMSLFRSDSKYSDMFKEFESGGASGSGGCCDDEESGDDEDGDGER